MKTDCNETGDLMEEKADWNHRLYTALLNSEYAAQLTDGLSLSFPMPGLSGEKKVIRVFLYPASSYSEQYGAPIKHFCLHIKDLSVIACHDIMEFDQEEVFSWEENLFEDEKQQDRIQRLTEEFDGILEDAFSISNEEARFHAMEWLSDLSAATGSQYRFYEWLSPEYIKWAVSDEIESQ